ncbi:Hypothetical protein CAP_8474 [Chondromyces apiculatus DSM 436]|uniref:Uncharacterized protein n=1 Tax=Chondromyces apiculatus DSM 436 TaxID=1192034 RepID=A0A017SXH1_9BACT|nr:Hypothetical protein CAP_8474 [Chondromyces apiculatus DSM 436]
MADQADNCPLAVNPDQSDANGNGAGDVCDCDDPAHTSCEDGNPCTLNDTCQNGVCIPGPEAECPDPVNLVCQQGACEPTNGACIHISKVEGTPCLEGGICIAGGCFTEPTGEGGSNEGGAGGAGGGNAGSGGDAGGAVTTGSGGAAGGGGDTADAGEAPGSGVRIHGNGCSAAATGPSRSKPVLPAALVLLALGAVIPLRRALRRQG